MPLVHKKRRQPCQQKIRKVVVSKKPRERAPGGALFENFRDARCARTWGHIQPRSVRHAYFPGDQPKKTDEPQSDEERPPPVPRYEHGAEKHSERRASSQSRRNERICSSAQRPGKMLRENFAVRRKSDRLAGSEDEAHHQQRLKAVNHGGRYCGDGPNEKSSRENPVHVEAVDQPARNKLEAGVRPEEGRNQNPQLPRG